MPDKHIKEYTEQLGQVTLSDASRDRLGTELAEYADFHATEGSAVPGPDRGAGKRSWQVGFFTVPRAFVPLCALVILVLSGGGTALVAQNSVPGDMLYPVKINISESLRGSLTFGTDDEAELQADILAERVTEAEALEADGRLSGAVENEVKSTVATQYQIASQANAEAELDTADSISDSLGRLATLLNTDTTVAVDSSGASYPAATTMEADDAVEESGMDVDMALTSEFAPESPETSQLLASAYERLKALRNLLIEYESDIPPDVHFELSAVLDEASLLLDQAGHSPAETVASEMLIEATAVLGEVEAELSLMGKLTIDPDTGMITDIDFSQPVTLE